MHQSVVRLIEELGVRVRLRDGRLQVKEVEPGAKERAMAEIVRQANELKRELELSAQHLPHIDRLGNLVIPIDSPRKYHWWAEGQSLQDTLLELRVPNDIWRRYVDEPTREKDV